jgi:hypothetical protein
MKRLPLPRLVPIAAALLAALSSGSFADDSTLELSAVASLRAQELARSNAAAHANALSVHSSGVRGRGVRISIIDTGVRATHNEFSGGRVVVSASRDLTRNNPTAGSGATDLHGHGTYVASIAAGGINNSGMIGIAPEATIISSQAMSAATGWGASGTSLLLAVRNGINAGAFIHNMSLGGSGPVGEAALREAVSRGTLAVVAAGNRGLANPDWPARYAKESWANNSIIAVGAVDSNNNIASFSNRAGDTANWYVVALGVNVNGAGSTSNSAQTSGSGTSMATPVVAGVAALIKSRWTKLQASQVGQIILATATDLGAPGVDAIYGRGLVNAERAMQPVGATGTRTANGQWMFSTTGTLLATTNAIGSRIASYASTGALNPVVFDSFERDFTEDVSTSVVTPRAVGFEGLASFSDRHIQFSEKTLDAKGSRMMLSSEVRTDMRRADGFELQTLANYEHRFRGSQAMLGAAWVQKFDGGMQFGVGSGGMNAFFGLQGMDTVTTQMYAQGLQNPMLGMMPLAQSAGIGLPLWKDWTVKFGAASTQGGNAVAEQLGISGGMALRQSMALAEVNRSIDEGRSMVGVQVASMNERESMLGGQGYGMMSLSGMNTATQAITLQAASRLDELTVVGAQFTTAYLPATGNSGASLVAGSTSMKMSGWGFGVTRFNALTEGDRFALTASEPLAVRTGAMVFAVPTGDDINNIGYRQEVVGLAGSARERLYEATWMLPFARGNASLMLSGMVRQNALGNADAPSELLGMMRLNRSF